LAFLIKNVKRGVEKFDTGSKKIKMREKSLYTANSGVRIALGPFRLGFYFGFRRENWPRSGSELRTKVVYFF